MEKYSIEQMTTGEWAVYGPKQDEESGLLTIQKTARKAALWLLDYFDLFRRF